MSKGGDLHFGRERWLGCARRREQQKDGKRRQAAEAAAHGHPSKAHAI